MNQTYLKLKNMSDLVIHAYSTYLHLGDISKFKEIAPHYMREYIQNMYKDEDLSSEAYIRCYERIEHFLAKYTHTYATETDHLLPFLKRCAINQFLNVRKAEVKLDRELPSVHYNDEYTQPISTPSLQPSTRRKILLECLRLEDPRFAIAFSLKFDLPLPEKSHEILCEKLRDLEIPLQMFWENHRTKRMHWNYVKQMHLSRINQLNQRILDQPFSANIFKWKHYKQKRLKSMEYRLLVGLYSFPELGKLLDMRPESLSRCLRYRTSKWKRAWQNSDEAKWEKKLDNFFPN